MEPIRIILCGASTRGEYLAQVFTADNLHTLVAIADPIIERAQYLSDTNGGTAAVYRTIEEALAAVPCDAVLVASSDADHAAGVVPALAAGKWVFCEKPIETTMAKCQAILDADRAAGGHTFVGFNLRYAPVYETVRQLIADGAIGRVLTIQADEFYDAGRTYFRRWNRLPECGGLWITKASHDFDLMNLFAGTSKAVDIFAVGRRTYYTPRADAAQYCGECALADTCPDKAGRPHPLRAISNRVTKTRHDLCLYNSSGDTFDHGIATVRYENDIYATYTCNVVSGFCDRRLRVSGTKGTIDGALSMKHVILRRRDPAAEETIPLVMGAGGHGGADGSLGREFAAFVRGTAKPRCDIATAVRAVQLGIAANVSMKENRVVPMSSVPFSA